MRIFFVCLLISITTFCMGQAEYLGLYLQGTKIGYAEHLTVNDTLQAQPVTRSDSKTVMNAGLLGTAMSIQMNSSTWRLPSGKPIRILFEMSSLGRVQKIDARFLEKTVVVAIENSGQKSQKELDLPDGQIVDDPITMIVAGTLSAGATQTFYVLDPTTVSFVKNSLKIVGPGKAKIGEKAFDATVVEVVDPRANMTLYLSAKGDLIKADGPMGIEMIPVSKSIALAKPTEYTPSIDLAFATSLKTDKPIVSPAELTGLKLRITAKALQSVPTDDHQTSREESGTWLIDIHPQRIDERTDGKIADAAAEKPTWTQPSMHIPSSSEEFRQLAKEIVGDETGVINASRAIQQWVFKEMKPNAGIGVLRNATEVLATKEGVCRDYAILTVTVLRAAGIPSKLASGLVNWDGDFYYHAWAEAWDGQRWIGIDSTTDRPQISAAHVKLAEGNVEEAFMFTFLDKAEVEVLGTKRN